MNKRNLWKAVFGLSFLSLTMSSCEVVTPSSSSSNPGQPQTSQVTPSSNPGQPQTSQVTPSSNPEQSQVAPASQISIDLEAEIRKIYAFYLEDGGAKSYEDWLASIKKKEGISIVGFEKTESDADSDTYTIRFSDGTSTQFTVKNGKDGKEAYSCTVLPSEHGYISVDVGSAFVGEDITFIAHPDEDYSIAHLYLNDVDVAPLMTDPLRYTTKMVKNGFVVRATFEINRRVSPEVFKREITDMSLLTDENGFTMEYTVDSRGTNYSSQNTVKIQKSGKYMRYESGSSGAYSSKSESLLIQNEDGSTYSAYYIDSGKWKKGPDNIEEDSVWAQLIPGFSLFSQFEYTYNENTGYYESEMEEVPEGMIPGSAPTSNFNAKLGFKNDRFNEFVLSFDQGDSQYGYHIEVNGLIYDYDGKTVIDPKWVQEVIDSANHQDITILISGEEEDVVQALIDEYKKENPDDKFDITLSTDTPSSVLYGGDGGDIFWFSQDQLNRYVNASILSPLDKATKADVIANNVASSIAGATIEDTLYAYPMTADNGYFLYYDKSVVAPEHLNDLEAILNDCANHGRKFAMDLSSAWYNAAFFFGAGCHSIWNGSTEQGFDSCDDSYYSPEGVAALKAISMVKNSSAYVETSSFSGAYDEAAVVVSGTWEYNVAKNALGDNLGCAALPSFTVDGKTYHMGSFNGCKYLGVKQQYDTAKQNLCHKLANYLTSEKAQLMRLEKLGYGPTNTEVAKSSLVKENPALQALYQQLEYATPQGQYPGNWWNIAGRLASEVKYYGPNPSDEVLKSILYEYNVDINDIAPNIDPTPTFPSGGQPSIIEEDPELEEQEPKKIVYTITGLPNWVANDNAAVFAWAWGGEAEKWVPVTLGTPGSGRPDAKELTATVELLETRIGFNLVRCVAGTETPDWTAEGDSDGRVYNKTGDVSIKAGTTSYASPSWSEYDPTK